MGSFGGRGLEPSGGTLSPVFRFSSIFKGLSNFASYGRRFDPFTRSAFGRNRNPKPPIPENGRDDRPGKTIRIAYGFIAVFADDRLFLHGPKSFKTIGGAKSGLGDINAFSFDGDDGFSLDPATSAGGTLVEYLFALAFSVSVGFAGFRLSTVFLRRVGMHRQNLQIKKMTGIFTGMNPFGIDAQGLARRAGFWTRLKVFRTYSEFLGSLIQRASKSAWSPSDIMVGQVLILFFLLLLFQILLANFPLAAGLSIIGAFLPVSWLRDLALRREAKILKEFPSALETLSLCAEAGLSLERGLSQYLETAGCHPLADELGKILEQTKLGSSRKDALRAFDRRLRLSDVTLFVTSVSHAERFGTGIAKTLRQLSETLRDKQSQRIEKAVNQLPVKMLIPLLLFIMPVTFLIIFGPVLLSFFN